MSRRLMDEARASGQPRAHTQPTFKRNWVPLPQCAHTHTHTLSPRSCDRLTNLWPPVTTWPRTEVRKELIGKKRDLESEERAREKRGKQRIWVSREWHGGGRSGTWAEVKRRATHFCLLAVFFRIRVWENTGWAAPLTGRGLLFARTHTHGRAHYSCVCRRQCSFFRPSGSLFLPYPPDLIFLFLCLLGQYLFWKRVFWHFYCNLLSTISSYHVVGK